MNGLAEEMRNEGPHPWAALRVVAKPSLPNLRPASGVLVRQTEGCQIPRAYRHGNKSLSPEEAGSLCLLGDPLGCGGKTGSKGKLFPRLCTPLLMRS